MVFYGQMETGVGSETKSLYESRANVLDRAMYRVDPQKPRSPEDRFEAIMAFEEPKTSKISLALNGLLEQNGHVIVFDPSISAQDNRTLRYLYMIGRDKMTTIAISTLGQKPRFIEQTESGIPGEMGLSLSPSAEANDQLVLKIFKGEMVIKTLSSSPSFPLEILVHKNYAFPVLAKDKEVDKPWFFNRRVFTPNQTGPGTGGQKRLIRKMQGSQIRDETEVV